MKWINRLCVHEFDQLNSEFGNWESFDAGSKPTVLLLGLTKNKEIILIHLYRFPVDTFCYELPGGSVNKGEDIEKAVKREFKEETGYIAGKVRRLCHGFHWNGRTNGVFEIWLGIECKKVHKINLDPAEKVTRLTVQLMKISEIKRRISQGDISIDPTISHGIAALEGAGLFIHGKIN